MKVIEIFLDNGVSLVCRDDDTSVITSLSERLSVLLSSKKVSILSTSDGSTLILKPSKIVTIKVIEENTPELKKTAKRGPKPNIEKKGEDYISDR
jgi:hypothetical protein